MYRYSLNELYPFPRGKDTALQELVARRRNRLKEHLKNKLESQLKRQYARLHPKIGRLQRKFSERRTHCVKVVLSGSSASLAAAVVCIVLFQFVADAVDGRTQRRHPAQTLKRSDELCKVAAPTVGRGGEASTALRQASSLRVGHFVYCLFRGKARSTETMLSGGLGPRCGLEELGMCLQKSVPIE